MQTTAAAPAPTPSAPSAPAEVTATGNIEVPSTPPPAPKAPKATKEVKANKAAAPENAPDTSEKTRLQFEQDVRELEGTIEKDKVQEGKAEKTGKEKADSLKEPGKDKAKEEEADPLQAELDAAAEAAGLQVKAEEPAKEEARADEEIEPPDASADKDVYEAWKKTLSKPAAKKIDQLERRAAKAQETAAERITLQPTISAPLSHITNLEQLEAEKAYWSDVRSKARNVKPGETVKITGTDGKKLELDPEIEEDQATLAGYVQWAEAAIDAAPDAKERIKNRASSKPWEKAEKLAPGMISDKDSYANKKALEILRSNPHLSQDPDYEVHLGHMVRSYQMEEDAKATEAYPKGKAKWVRLPVDKEGNVIRPKTAVASKDTGKKPPTASDSRPLATSRTGTNNANELYVKAEKSQNPDDLLAALAADLR